MRVDFFIARRIYFNQKNNELVSRPAVKVAVAGIIIGVAVMLLTIGVVIGFKHEISHKVSVLADIFRWSILIIIIPMKCNRLWWTQR